VILPIHQAIDNDLVRTLRQAGEQDALFRDGAVTAGWYARSRKHNQQASADSALDSTLDQLRRQLLQHELVRACARPRRIIRLLLSRYDRGMQYGAHTDDALMDGYRTDLSFTLFVSAPEEYEGGELVIDETDGEKSFRLPAGSLLLYPSTTVHRVNPVSQGRRVAVVGWLQSHIRCGESREILFDLDRVIHQLRQEAGHRDSTALQLLLKTRSNLLRRWAE